MSAGPRKSDGAYLAIAAPTFGFFTVHGLAVESPIEQWVSGCGAFAAAALLVSIVARRFGWRRRSQHRSESEARR